MAAIPPKPPIGFSDYLLSKRQSDIIKENVRHIDLWLEGKIDSEELKAGIKYLR